ncbi:DeoR/GlpR family DNA-binding transcription regulator [Mycolicibacterium smegmatis]|uniref:DeoR/GlpR family DNA-binding transcription regulator n=1 Tax=Mycolicibacterium smegmatis TaxID=1772 RepID=UPI001CC062DB|nr:DeoR/GlpR family DNA-binding transcription regulator [Mycolicibacterium smegmatis]MDF1898034.1 DeoR/GlpR family DNA-binding transcription regulator [Mycolicibacterium smegmatis]MDF1904939.1 DeoR/GlpR family DNA-binding transcription regulator [Mycolicibacterium smegmatis]MDF1916793.1 DeoR/GlpR family DNA-binding transcription regulator [Mycolicibacterium smegmatis]MDF1923273.1 DeoR/GlpR family DNA-binding transcription regulator [Mycolicibacterium smegmatis]UGT72478.1 DeoR/GlpR family DNA-b
MTGAAKNTEELSAMSIKRTDRMREVLSLLRERGEVTSQVLCTELKISAATLRRDLSELEEQGLLVRTHGGARAVDPSDSEIPVRLRDHRMVAIKRRIAQHAAALVPPGQQAVALTGGITTGEVARALRGRPQITIVTNSLTIAADCAVDAHMKVIMTGGVVRSKSLEAVGPMSEHAFQVITVGTAVLGADGMSAGIGATTFDEGEARTAIAMASNAQRVVVAVDGSKIGKVTLAKMVPLDQIDHLVTDSTADRAELDRITAAGVQVHVVDVSDG